MKKAFNWAKDREKVLLEGARRAVYKTIEDGGELAIHFFLPKEFAEGPPRPVLLFFNGGAWDRGSVIQFAPHALYFVGRGAVGGLVEYRNRTAHPGSTPSQAVQDARAAFRYVRSHAGDCNADPARVVGIGAGAGANLVGAALMKAPLSPTETDFRPEDSQPNGAVLVSALLDLKRGGYGYDQCSGAAEARRLSLSRLIEPGLPPMLLIHGTEDRFVPFEEVSEFAGKMVRKHNPCRLVEFEGRDRDFFNLNFDPLSFEACLAEIDTFLDAHDLLKRREDEAGPHLLSWREGDF